MRFKTLLTSLALAALAPVSVAFAAPSTVQGYLIVIVQFFNKTLIPFIFAIALLFFFVNVTKYYIIEGGDSYSRSQAKQYMLYAIIALVVITSLWGIVDLIVSSLGFGGHQPICPDYIKNCTRTPDSFPIGPQ